MLEEAVQRFIHMHEDPIQQRVAERIGERLRWARECVVPSREELARDVGCGAPMLRKIEVGQRIPSVFLLLSLCHVLRVSPNYLLWGTLDGVEPELAAMLSERHPELRKPTTAPFPGKTRKSVRRNTAAATRKPARRSGTSPPG